MSYQSKHRAIQDHAEGGRMQHRKVVHQAYRFCTTDTGPYGSVQLPHKVVEMTLEVVPLRREAILFVGFAQ